MLHIKRFFTNYKIFFLLSILFFLLRFYQLTIIPIFNDEAIYLDWSWRQFNTSNNLFYSLYDAKPPLLLWIFGAANLFFQSLLISGRFVSVLFGYITAVGIWFLTKKLLSKKTANIAFLLYIFIPIFSFFDRQALMESAISAVGIWAAYGLLRLIETNKYKWSLFIGIVLGLGCLIKQTAILFFLTTIILLTTYWIKKRLNIFDYLIHIGIIMFTMFIVLFPMLIQHEFWDSIYSNNRYIISLSTFISEGSFYWIQKIISIFQVLFFQLTPLVFLLFCISCFFIMNKRTYWQIKYILLWFFISFFLDVFLVKTIIERHIVSFLPIVIVAITYILQKISTKKNGMPIIIITLINAGFFTLIQIQSPQLYFSLLQKTYPAHTEYTNGFSSGYGIREAVAFLKQQIGNNQAFIATALNTGNPESGVMTSFMNNRNVLVSYMEASYIQDIKTYDCLSSSIPIYFVSRETDTRGLDRFLEQIYYEKNPISGFGIGIYTLKQPCTGKTLNLSGFKT